MIEDDFGPPEQSCYRKARYHTEKVAEKMRKQLQRMKGEERLHSYSCEFCGGWHVGHMKRFNPPEPQ